MRIKKIKIHPYQFMLKNGSKRSGVILELISEFYYSCFSELAPYKNFSFESLDEALNQLSKIKKTIYEIDWNEESLMTSLLDLKLLPSLHFALESALLQMITTLSPFEVDIAGLLMGTVDEIFLQAEERKREGYKTVKVKISQLNSKEAFDVIEELKKHFRLRLDVNKAWTTKESLKFFSQFSQDSFEYVEEPFKNPLDLHLFPHPIAIDESYPSCVSIEQLEKIPTLKALIYKPTIQGGLGNCLSLYKWTSKRNLDFILSSAFETDIGLYHISTLAKRLHLKKPIGIGTYHFFEDRLFKSGFEIRNGKAYISEPIRLNAFNSFNDQYFSTL